jgi:predicted GH43/DUF377 family glycosyl hydrolase
VSLKPYALPVERLFGGAPILRPTENAWESGVTFNSAAVYLERSETNDPIIRRLLEIDSLEDPCLRDGLVALHYRARPRSEPDTRWNRSFIGLALFTPDLAPLKRYAVPVMLPGAEPDSVDALGVEDPRITRFGDTFYAVYCGVSARESGDGWKAANCLARSGDLRHWTKLGALQGDLNCVNNKDGALFPETIDGSYYLLHRPMVGPVSSYGIQLAVCDSPDGVWKDWGTVLRSWPHPDVKEAWVGAGSVPISLGQRRYLVIYHTGNVLHSGEREYELDAAILDFARFSPENPATLVEKRIERILVPETETERRAPFSDSVANVVFTCGTYVFEGYLYIVYGGGDTYILAARIHLQTLLYHLECSDTPDCTAALPATLEKEQP